MAANDLVDHDVRLSGPDVRSNRRSNGTGAVPTDPSASAVSEDSELGVGRRETQFELDPDIVGVSLGDPSANRWFLAIADSEPVTWLRVEVHIRETRAVADPRLDDKISVNRRSVVPEVIVWRGPRSDAPQSVMRSAQYPGRRRSCATARTRTISSTT